MPETLGLAAIRIHIDPSLINVGPVHLTWHGFFTFLGILTVVIFAARRASKHGIPEDAVYNTAAVAVIGGIVGARLFHVIDFWSFYVANPLQILNLLSGGIALTGGIIGATLAGMFWIWRTKLPLGLALDITAPAAPIGQMVGRIGDIINGEHFSTFTNLPWGFIYSHPGSPSFGRRDLTGSDLNFDYLAPDGQVVEVAAQQPVIVYEMMWDVLIAGILIYMIGRIKPPGMVFASYLALYAVGRFTIQLMRQDDVWFAGLQEAHLLALGLLAVTVPILVAKARLVKGGEDPYVESHAQLEPAPEEPKTASRRRRDRRQSRSRSRR